MDPYILYLNVFVIFNLFLIIISTLVGNKFDSKANIFFALFFIISLRQIISNLIVYYFRWADFIFSEISLGGLNLLIGPIIFHYVYALTEQKFPQKWIWHYVPSLLFFFYGLSYLFLPKATVDIYFQEILQGTHLPVILLNLLILLHTIIYFTAIKFALKKIVFDASNANFGQLMLKKKWSNDFVNYLIACNIIVIITYTCLLVGFAISTIIAELVVIPMVLLAIYSFIIFKNLKFNAIYGQVLTINNVGKEPKITKDSPAENPNMLELSIKLDEYFKNKKPFTNPALGLQKLAEELDVSPTLLSKTIHRQYDISFTDYVNRWRVNEAKELLVSEKNQHLKIEAIGEMAGFNSRSAFYSVFKKYTGMTPVAFKSIK